MKIPAWISNLLKPTLYFNGELTEILFESRNKSYGAYTLRHNYIRNKIIGTISAYLIFLVCIISPSLKCNKDQTPLVFMTEVRLEAPPELVMPKLIKKSTSASSNKADIKLNQAKSTTMIKVLDDKVAEPIQKNETKTQEILQKDSIDQSTIQDSERTGMDYEGDFAVDFADVMPQFPGGNNALSWFIHSKLIYPREAVSVKTEGIVVIGFVVDSYGRVKHPKVLKSLTPLCDAEALRVVRLIPDWIPGKNKGRNVSVQFKLPIEFKLAR